MLRTLSLLAVLVAVFITVSIFQRERRRAAFAAAVLPAASAESQLPKMMLWVWERPEDMHELHRSTEGAAVFEGTLRLERDATFLPRRQPILLPASIQRIAVVRIETVPQFHSSSVLLSDAVENIVKIASEPGVAALQIDFDARRSQRQFYRSLLRSLRDAVPVRLPIEMTALVSWCDEDDWISELPVSSAIPMFFRMEPGRAKSSHTIRPSASLPESLCQHSVGVSTHEPWPSDIMGKRLYVFADHGWKSDLPLLRAMEKR